MDEVDVTAFRSEIKEKRPRKVYVVTRAGGNEVHLMTSLTYPKRTQDRDQEFSAHTKGTSETFAALHAIYKWIPDAPPPPPYVEPAPVQEVVPQVEAPIEAPVAVPAPVVVEPAPAVQVPAKKPVVKEKTKTVTPTKKVVTPTTSSTSKKK